MTSSGSLSGRAVFVPRDRLAQLWQHAEPHLARAVAQCGDWTVADILAGLFGETLQLWVAFDGDRINAAAVTELDTVARGKVCRVVACGGRKHVSWADCIAPIEDFARAQGCVAMRIHGRPGWARVFDDYETEWVALEKRLSDAGRQ